MSTHSHATANTAAASKTAPRRSLVKRSGAQYEQMLQKSPGYNTGWQNAGVRAVVIASIVGFVFAEDAIPGDTSQEDLVMQVVRQVMAELAVVQTDGEKFVAQAVTPKPTVAAFAKIIRESPPNFWSGDTVRVSFSRVWFYVGDLIEDELPLFLVFSLIMGLAIFLAIVIPFLERSTLPFVKVPEPAVRVLANITFLFFLFGGLAIALFAVGGSIGTVLVAYGVVGLILMPNLSGIVSNAISAFTLPFEKKLRVGSEIVCEGKQGIILEFTLRNVVLLKTGPDTEIGQGRMPTKESVTLIPNEYITKYPSDVLGIVTNISELKIMIQPQLEYRLELKND
jgi:small-conductance mechanosensitive channel